jgi:hypothetical protein
VRGLRTERDATLGGQTRVSCDRGVTAEIDLYGWSEPPQMVVDTRLRPPHDEACLGLPELPGDGLHLLIRQAIGPRHHARRISGAGNARERVDDIDWPTQSNLRGAEWWGGRHGGGDRLHPSGHDFTHTPEASDGIQHPAPTRRILHQRTVGIGRRVGDRRDTARVTP